MAETDDKRNRISSGSFDLNKWLFGGYEKDIITMIAGPAGSGKTNFCVMAAASQAKKGNKVIFIDTEGGFSVERIKQLVANADETEKILENVLLMKPTNFNEQKKSFTNLLKSLKQKNVGLIIVDGMTMLYRLELGDASQLKDELKIKSVNKDLARQMRDLAEISRKQNIPVIITNQVYSEFIRDEDLKKGVERKVNLVGGDLLKYWSKCIIELKQDDGKRKAILVKHRSLPTKELSFEIKDRGIFKKGWI